MPSRSENYYRLMAERIRSRRLDIGLSQEALAEKAGLHINLISLMERSRANPTLDTIIRVAKILGCKPHELILPGKEK